MSASPSPPKAAASSSSADLLSLRFYAGLTLAGTASSVLTCLFSLLHLQVFLQAYHLPLKAYSVGSSIFAVINTANDVLGAYLVDSLAATSQNCCGGRSRARHEWVGWSGCLFAVCFLTPFFRLPSTEASGNNNNNNNTGLWHFVTSMSAYDTMFSFHCILLSSIITDHSGMSDEHRITFLAVGKVTNLLAPMIFAKLALSRMDPTNLQPLRQFLIVAAVTVCGVSVVAQRLLSTPSQSNTRGGLLRCCRAKLPKSKVEDDLSIPLNESTPDYSTGTTIRIANPHDQQQSSLLFKQIVKDFVQHPNFRYWICMELLLEAQTTFMKSFMKTFVDHLLLQHEGQSGGFSRSTCDWFLSSRHVLVAITSLGLLYGPIKRYGYATVYSWVFRINLVVSGGLILWLWSMGNDGSILVLNDRQHRQPVVTGIIFFFLLFYPTILGAVGSASFPLAMADQVLEMKQLHASQGRMGEPSLAGLFMGVNALFCKPAESVLPILTATMLGQATDFRSDSSSALASSSNTNDTTTDTVLLRILLIPSFVCAILQLWAWSHYDLHPPKTARLRKEWEAGGHRQTLE